MKRINFIILAIILLSCAPQDEKKLGILGRWKLNKFVCYVGLPNTVNPSAEYLPANSSNTITILVDGRDITYNASGTSGATSSTTNIGTYQVASRVSVDSGSVTYSLQGPFTAVNMSVNARQPGTVSPTANVAANVTVDAAFASNRFFQNLGTQLAIEIPVAFVGGADSFCQGACTSCVGIFDQF